MTKKNIISKKKFQFNTINSKKFKDYRKLKIDELKCNIKKVV